MLNVYSDYTDSFVCVKAVNRKRTNGLFLSVPGDPSALNPDKDGRQEQGSGKNEVLEHCQGNQEKDMTEEEESTGKTSGHGSNQDAPVEIQRPGHIEESQQTDTGGGKG